MRLSRLILLVVIAVVACTPAHHPAGAVECDPTAVSDNGCPDGQTCSLMNIDKISGERYTRCEPSGGADEMQPCGKAKQCRPGHLCNITPSDAPKDTTEPGVCLRLCNMNFPVCPGSSCHELRGGGPTEYLSVDGVRYGICSGVGAPRSGYTKE